MATYLSHDIQTTSAGFDGTGEIRFSQLRNKFKKTSSGIIKASELFRITDRSLKYPLVPDSKENEDAGVPATIEECKENDNIDWRVSQMISVIVRYEVTNDIPNENVIGHQSSLWNDNLTRNIPKIYWIDNNITSSSYLVPALQFRRDDISNLTIEFNSSASVRGAFGIGGGTPLTVFPTAGGPGGDAIWFDAENGYNNEIKIPNRSDIVIAGGGGGGGKGGTGADGPQGVKWFPRVNNQTSNYDTTKTPSQNMGEWYSYRKGGGDCSTNNARSQNTYVNNNRCYSDPSMHVNNSILLNGTTYNTRVYGGNNGQITSGSWRSSVETSDGCDTHCKDRVRVCIPLAGCVTLRRWNCDEWGKIMGPGYCAVEDPELRDGGPGGEGGIGGDGTGTTTGGSIVQKEQGNIGPGVGEPGGPLDTTNMDNYGSIGNVGSNGGDGGHWGQDGEDGENSSYVDTVYTVIKSFTFDDNNKVTLDVNTGVYTFMVDGNVVAHDQNQNSSQITIDDRRYTAGDNLIDTVSTPIWPSVEGARFDENGNLVVTGSTNTLIRISIGWDDKKGGGDHGVAWESYTIPELGVNFQVRNEGNNVTEWGARTQVVEVEPNRIYTAILTRGSGTSTATWRHNNNQRFCIPDQDGTDANAQIWISAPNKVFPSSSGEVTERINRDRLAYNSLVPPSQRWYYWPSNDGNTDNNGPSGLYPDEVDEAGNPTGNKVQIRGMVDPDVMSSNTTSDISPWSDTGVASVGTIGVDESQIYEVQVESISGGDGEGSEGSEGGEGGDAIGGNYNGKGIGYTVTGYDNETTIKGDYAPYE